MPAERRKFPRLDAKLPVTYCEASSSALTPSVSRNLSAGGLCFRVSQPLEANTPLVIDVTLPDQTDIRFDARVVWCRPLQEPRGRVVEIGVEFTRIDSKDRDRIMGFTVPPGA